MSATVIIPARYDSTRFPGKPLTKINGISMLKRCIDNAIGAVGQENTFVATDHIYVSDLATLHGCKVIMTPKECQCSSDRVSEAVKNIDTDVIVDLQGDEPLVTSQDIINVIKLKRSVHDAVIGAYCYEKGDINNSNTIKVVSRGMHTDELAYMSRQPLGGRLYKKQIGLYVYYKEQLLRSYGIGKARGSFEQLEDCHILRCLDNHQKVLMLKLKGQYQSVDVEEDVKKVEEILNAR